MATNGHLLYYPEGKHDILLGKELKDVLKSKVNSVTKITYQDLKDLRDNSKLTPGALYRITDYQCTTTQENTRSAGHQFDIVLLALSENKLAEEGWAMMHDNIYDVTFGDGVTKKCYIYRDDYTDNIVDCESLLGFEGFGNDEITINEEQKTAVSGAIGTADLDTPNLTYNYFKNSKLEAWKVWYCLDNDKSRFAWASDIEQLIDVDSNHSNGAALKRCPTFDGAQDYRTDYRYAWGCQEDIDDGDTMNFLYSKTESLKAGDQLYYPSDDTLVVTSIGSVTGRGVIYRLIDEFNNDIKYDFKNIQFKRKLTDGQYDANGTETWCYTLNLWYNDMCQDASIVGNTLLNGEGYIQGVYDNVFGYATAYDLIIEGADTFAFALGDNVVLSFDSGDEYHGIYSNIIRNAFYNNTIGNFFYHNTIGNEFSSNTIGNMFNSNIIGNTFNVNTIGENFYSNTIGNEFVSNTIGDDTSYKNYGNNGVELATKDDLN